MVKHASTANKRPHCPMGWNRPSYQCLRSKLQGNCPVCRVQFAYRQANLGSNHTTNPLYYYGSDGSGSISDTIAYGNIYSSAYAGIVYCYSGATGDILWTYGNGGEGNSTNSGVETPFGYYPTFVSAIGKGVVYAITTEHTEEEPIFKGAVERAIHATTGPELWTLSCYTGEFLLSSYAIADGYSVSNNGYNN